MSKLKNLDKHNHGHNVHERCVKLKVFLSRANVITGTENPLKNQSNPHCVEYSKMVGDSFVDLLSFCFCSYNIVPILLMKSPRFVFCQNQKNQAKPNISNVAEKVVEIC